MSGYLIYHPARMAKQFDGHTVYYDSSSGNQDPYIWSARFLHTYCHITQMAPRVGQINFWVGGDTFPTFSHLYCDLVFVVAEKMYWAQRNSIAPDDPLVDSAEAYNDHYRWAGIQHSLKRRRRFTLKADPARSFQPQDAAGQRIDLVPILGDLGLPIGTLRAGLRANRGSRPFGLEGKADALYRWLDEHAAIKLKGQTLQQIRRQNPQLASL